MISLKNSRPVMLFMLIFCISGLMGCQDNAGTREQWKVFLEAEDFATGALGGNAGASHAALVEAVLRAKGFDDEVNREQGDESDTLYESVKCLRDDLVFKYWWGVDARGPLQSLSVVSQEIPARRVDAIEGVPDELLPGSSLDDVLSRWGVGSAYNAEELKQLETDPSALVVLEYPAKYASHCSCIFVSLTGKVVVSATLEIWVGQLEDRVDVGCDRR